MCGYELQSRRQGSTHTNTPTPTHTHAESTHTHFEPHPNPHTSTLTLSPRIHSNHTHTHPHPHTHPRWVHTYTITGYVGTRAKGGSEWQSRRCKKAFDHSLKPMFLCIAAQVLILSRWLRFWVTSKSWRLSQQGASKELSSSQTWRRGIKL
jgi:hypothetical protein